MYDFKFNYTWNCDIFYSNQSNEILLKIMFLSIFLLYVSILVNWFTAISFIASKIVDGENI